MRHDWTFHCYADMNYWECSIMQERGVPHWLRAEATFETRADALRDAKQHGLDIYDETHIVVFKRYTTTISSHPDRADDRAAKTLQHFRVARPALDESATRRPLED
jgi:hypothetical protein